MNSSTAAPTPAEVVFFNGKIATQDDKRSFADALAVANGRVVASGPRDAVMRHAVDSTRHVDLKGRTVIPGLNDSHLHVIRGGLNFNLELRWDGVPSLADALRHAAQAGCPHAGAPVGARGRRLERIPVRRTPRADARRNQRDCAGYAGLRPASLRQRAAERGGAASGRLYEGHARPSGRRDPARQARQSDRHADRAAERRASVRHARQRPEARAGGPAQFVAALHARAEPPRRDERDRCGRRLSEVSG